MKSVVSFMWDGNAAANDLKNSSTYADNFSVRPFTDEKTGRPRLFGL